MSERRPTRVDKRQKLLDAEHAENMRFVLGHRRGRALLWWLLGVAGVEEGSFNPNALLMAHNEGRRSVGNQLRAEILEVDEELYLTMQREARTTGAEPAQENEDEC